MKFNFRNGLNIKKEINFLKFFIQFTIEHLQKNAKH